MWHWLGSLFQWGRDPSFYKPYERKIYSFFDGKSTRKVDPLDIYKKIMEIGPELDVDIKVMNSIHSDAPKAQSEVIKKIRTIFNIKPFEEGGLTGTESMDLFWHFMTYCGLVKKNSSQSQISPEETSAHSESSSTGPPPLPNSSVSGSTGEEHSTDKQMPLPSVQV